MGDTNDEQVCLNWVVDVLLDRLDAQGARSALAELRSGAGKSDLIFRVVAELETTVARIDGAPSD